MTSSGSGDPATPHTPGPRGSPSPRTRALREAKPEEVTVFLLTSDPHSNRAQLVSDLFSDPLFAVRSTVVALPREHQLSGKGAEAYRVATVLQQARRMQAKSIIIIKDSSVSVVSPEVMRDVVRAALQEAVDLLYLAYWEERCSRFRAGTSIANTTVSLYDAIDPHGFQAVMLSPRAQAMLLQHPSISGNMRVGPAVTALHKDPQIRASVCFPPLIMPDVATGDQDTRKARICTFGDLSASEAADTPAPTPPRPSSTHTQQGMVIVEDFPLVADPSASDDSVASNTPSNTSGVNSSGTASSSTGGKKKYFGWVGFVLFIVLLVLVGVLAYLFFRQRATTAREPAEDDTPMEEEGAGADEAYAPERESTYF